MADEYRISDDDLPMPIGEVVAAPLYKPTENDQLALEAFIESGGSIHEAGRASGAGISTLLALTRKTWWRKALTERNFVPITVEEIGGHVARQAGVAALERLIDPTVYLDTNDLVKLGNLGVAMSKTSTDINVTNVQIGSLQQVDLRGMTPEQLRILAGGDDEIIDV
jgi:hypothetical protein